MHIILSCVMILSNSFFCFGLLHSNVRRLLVRLLLGRRLESDLAAARVTLESAMLAMACHSMDQRDPGDLPAPLTRDDVYLLCDKEIDGLFRNYRLCTQLGQ